MQNWEVLNSAFGFLRSEFRPFPSRPSGSRCREREVASAIGPRRHAHSPAPRGLGPRWARTLKGLDRPVELTKSRRMKKGRYAPELPPLKLCCAKPTAPSSEV